MVDRVVENHPDLRHQTFCCRRLRRFQIDRRAFHIYPRGGKLNLPAAGEILPFSQEETGVNLRTVGSGRPEGDFREKEQFLPGNPPESTRDLRSELHQRLVDGFSNLLLGHHRSGKGKGQIGAQVNITGRPRLDQADTVAAQNQSFAKEKNYGQEKQNYERQEQP